MEQKIKEMALALGADVCGISDISRFSDAPEGFSPLDIYPDCKSVIAFGKALPKGLTKVSPRIIYAHFNANSEKDTDIIAFELARFVERELKGIAVPLPSDGPYDSWDAENLHGHGIISVKHAAVNCGLGTLGKNTLLLNREYGNLLSVGVVLTDLQLEPDPLCDSICITGCKKCIEACPVHAINADGTVNQKLCRTNTYSKNKRGFDTVECNMCRTVCPMKYGK